MSGDPQSRITAFWSVVAPGYEAHPGNVVAPGTPEHDLWVDRLRDLLPEAGWAVLDVGTGQASLH